MARWRAIGGAVASCALLSGCASAQLPAGPTPDEVSSIVAGQYAQWWDSIAPGEPMPVVEPVDYLGPDDDGHQITDCIVNAQLPGILGDDPFAGALTPETQNRYERVQFVCSLTYPFDMTDPEQVGLYSEAQLQYLYEYFTDRLVPCLVLLGYGVGEVPGPELFVGTGYLAWSPYDAMVPQPLTIEEWRRVDLRCPPPPIGSYWRAGIGYGSD